MEHPAVIKPSEHGEWRSDKMGKTTLWNRPVFRAQGSAITALGLDRGPRRPKFLVIRAKEDYERVFITKDRALQSGRRFGKSAKKCGHYPETNTILRSALGWLSVCFSAGSDVWFIPHHPLNKPSRLFPSIKLRFDNSTVLRAFRHFDCGQG